MNAPIIAIDLRDLVYDLSEIRAWIDVWREDKAHKLFPTDTSLAIASTKLDVILRRLK